MTKNYSNEPHVFSYWITLKYRICAQTFFLVTNFSRVHAIVNRYVCFIIMYMQHNVFTRFQTQCYVDDIALEIFLLKCPIRKPNFSALCRTPTLPVCYLYYQVIFQSTTNMQCRFGSSSGDQKSWLCKLRVLKGGSFIL